MLQTIPLTFQKCVAADLEVLVEVSKKTFVEAFEKDNNPDDFKRYIKGAFSQNNIKQQLLNLNSSFYFVSYKKDLVGYLKLNENSAQTDIKSENAIELERIYVLKKHQSKGFGSQMLLMALDYAAKKKKKFLWLGVWQKNESAVRFYERQGFIKFGTHPYYIGKDKQTDWLMRYDLTNFKKS